MKELITFPYLASILVSAVIAFVYRKHLRNKGLLIFVPYLLLVFIQELSIYFYLKKFPEGKNGIVYNIYKPITVILFSALYYRAPFNASARKLMIWLVAGYLIVNVVTYSFIASIFTLNSYVSLIGGFVITCCAIFFLLNYFNLDNNTEEKYWQPMIWITIGILIFYPVIGISYAFREQLVEYQVRIFGKKLYHLIPQVMSIFMYSCFVKAFFLCKKTN